MKCKYKQLKNSTKNINQTEWQSECGLHVCIPEGYKYIKDNRGMYRTDILRLPDEEKCMKCGKEIIIEITKQPEEPMTEKIQMTEEQAKQLRADCFSNISEENFLIFFELNGYIIKPEIEQRIDSIEKQHKDFFNNCAENSSRTDAIKIMTEYYNVLQLLKPYYYKSKEK